jgi:hypothetical protein
MQISRHWRLNAQRYRLEGVRLEDGSISLQSRVTSQEDSADVEINEVQDSNQTNQRVPSLQWMAL